jgi:hypothetical protein
MKERILAALKAKFQGVNANILDRIAAMLAKTVTVEDQVATAVEGVTRDFIDVIEAYGDSRATDTQKTAVLNYEKKYGLKDGVKVVRQSDETSVSTKEAVEDETPEWAKALIKSNEQLTERLNRMEGERTAASRKAELEAIIVRLPENQRKGYQRISVDSMTDEEFSTLKGEISSEVDEIVKETGAKGAVFGRPSGNGGKMSGASANQQEATEAEATAVVDKLNI